MTDTFTFHPMTEEHLPMLRAWLRREHVSSWWPSPSSLDELRNEFLPAETYGAARPFIAFSNGIPVGYIQYYLVDESDGSWWPDDPPSGTFGIDQFLADENQLGRGIGTSMIRQFATMLFRDSSVQEIRVDPHPDNHRAIRCYQRVGFRQVGPIVTPDGPAVLMVLSRSDLVGTT